MLRIVVCGYMIRMPVAGNVLAFAQYLLGFERLGHSVLYVEESGWHQPCYHPDKRRYDDNPIPGIKIVSQLLAAAGSSCKLAYFDTVNDRTYGMERADLERQIIAADLVLNLGGICWLPIFEDAQRLVLVDMDPMFTQVGKFGHARLQKYAALFTYGTNIGQADCNVPTLGINWKPTVPPVVPELWCYGGLSDVREAMRFTSIANWSAYGRVEWNGETYGQKDWQLLDLIELPSLTEATLELAVSGMPMQVADRFRAAGWELNDATQVSRSLEDYQRYIWQSAGEFSVAKHGYVRSRSGWISDRTVCYLAAGKPAVVQETGVPTKLIGGEGWFTFIDARSAAEALAAAYRDYTTAQQGALQLAYEVFSYARVIPALLDRI